MALWLLAQADVESACNISDSPLIDVAVNLAAGLPHISDKSLHEEICPGVVLNSS